jgi:hypothetical protein
MHGAATSWAIYTDVVHIPRYKTVWRWLTFRNMYILLTNLIFLTALILRFNAYQNNQCR